MAELIYFSSTTARRIDVFFYVQLAQMQTQDSFVDSLRQATVKEFMAITL